MCASVKAVKYLYKYVYKGHDRVQVCATANEVDKFLEGRYLSPCEACHRIFGFKTNEQTIPVVRLDTHLPNKQSVTFCPNAATDTLRGLAETPPYTQLTAWFQVNSDNRQRRVVTGNDDDDDDDDDI